MKSLANRFLGLVAISAIVWIAVGCKEPKKVESDPAKTPSSTKPIGEPPAVQPSAEADLPKGLPIEDMPAALKAAAFEYYGLGNPETVRYDVTSPNATETQEGTQTLRLTEVGENEAKFTVVFGGAMLMRGNQEMVLKPDGLYVTKLADKELDKPMLELPNDLSTGKRWTSSVTMDDPTGQPVKMTATFWVVGPEKLKTKAGEFDTIRVDGTMTAKSTARTIKTPLSGWYAKGTGQIKFVVKGVNGDSKDPKQTLTVELSK